MASAEKLIDEKRKSSAKYKANKNAQDLAEGNQCASSHLCYLAERIELVIASGHLSAPRSAASLPTAS